MSLMGPARNSCTNSPLKRAKSVLQQCPSPAHERILVSTPVTYAVSFLGCSDINGVLLFSTGDGDDDGALLLENDVVDGTLSSLSICVVSLNL